MYGGAIKYYAINAMQFRYISDPHLYDIQSIDWRPGFDNLDLYARFFLDTWNTFTDDDDVVLMVGDIGHFCQRTVEVLRRCKGVKILVVGNHDAEWGNNIYTCGIFSGVHYAIDYNGIHVQHIPEARQALNGYYIHGHHHRYDMPGMQAQLAAYVKDTCRLNCCADLNGHKPCTIQELILNKELNIEHYRNMRLI